MDLNLRNRPREYRQGVGVMLVNHRRQVLMCRRIDVPDGAWQMPQGGVDNGEDPRRAALRELKEEIGTDDVEILAETRGWLSYDLPPELLNSTWGGKYAGQRQKWFLMRFRGSDDAINLDMQRPEFNRWIWVLPDHAPDLVVAFKRIVYQRVLAEFRDALEKIAP